MSRQFWSVCALVLLACGIVVPAVGWFLGIDDRLLFVVGCVGLMCGGYALQLARFSKSRSDPPD
jgi:hypothetical protein